ncbi:MAG: aspartate aminotransferase family protein [Ignavibacteria bacterium]|nr:aspartate aminotransferase family protein [Ignavibacteria bacterium]
MTIQERESAFFFNTYKRLALEIDRGDGVYLITKNGERYLDMFAGIAVNALGYNHPEVNAAITRQVSRYLHLSNMFYQDTQIELAERLVRESGYSKVFFTNSGTEAMEGSLKLARRWGRTKGKTAIFGLTNSFHGRTFGSMSVTGRDKYREGYEPFLPNTCILSFNDVEELRRNVNDTTLALVLEFIQGEGGIHPVSEEYVSALEELREKFGFLIIADEIQSGIGRTGKFFSFDHFNIRPDIVVVAKAIGGGLPLGAFLGSEALSNVFTPGVHGTTFGGNPVACAAGLATLREILDNGVQENARMVGDYLKGRLEALQTRFPDHIAEVRGKGLMLGVDLKFDGTAVVDKLLSAHVLVNLTSGTVLRWLPPLILRKEEADIAISALTDILAAGEVHA